MTNNQIPQTVTKKKTKGRTFQCTGYPDCNMTFIRSEHLARHIRKHTGERPFECIHCARKFSRLDNLRQHKQTVHAHEQHNGNNSNDNEYNKSEVKQIDEGLGEKHNKENNLLQQSSANLPAAATSLVRPTQFRSKHRPRPIALPSRKAVYNDAPYTVPTPRSATSSNQLLISPTSPSNSMPLQYPKSTTSSQFQHHNHLHPNSHGSGYSQQQQYLPSVQFITSTGQHADSLISPYNSSFGSNLSNANTPTNTSFDTNLKTPTNMSFGFTKAPIPMYNHYHDNNSQNHNLMNSHVFDHDQQQQQQQQQQAQQAPHRRSWLNNVLNNEQKSPQIQTSSPQQQQPQYQYNGNYSSSSSSASSASSSKHSILQQQPQSGAETTSQSSRVRIENLLNSSASSTNLNASSSSLNTTSSTTNNESDRIKLPHVSHLGINISKN